MSHQALNWVNQIRLLGTFVPNTPYKKAESVAGRNPSLLTGSVFYSAIFYNSNFVLIDMILAGRNTVNKI